MTTTAPEQTAAGTEYVCPMCPEVREPAPGACPSCGMALEPETLLAPANRTEYTCPMHPEIVRDGPGDCPKCGMALEPRTVTADAGPDPELVDMSRRFWVSAALALPVLLLAMVADLAPGWLPAWLSMRAVQWIELVLATPVVLWGGWPLLVRGWRSVATWKLNMFTLIGLGVSVAWGYSLVALFARSCFRRACAWPMAACRCISRRRRSSPPWCCWGRCWSCAPAAAPMPRSGCCSGSRPTARGGCATTAPKKTSCSIRCSLATGCGCAPARRCRWTAASSAAAAMSTSPWSPASRCRWPRPRATN